MAAFRKLRQALGLRRPRPGRHVVVGRHTYGVEEATVVNASAESPVTIGRYCSIADGVQIHGATHHPVGRVSTYPFRHMFRSEAEPGLAKGPVVIGDDVWIGSRAIVLSNLTIGSGAVIGAGSVVTRDVAPYAIVAGNPARLIRYRFEPAIVEALLRIAWWDLPDGKVVAELDGFYGSVDHFVARHAPVGPSVQASGIAE